MLNNLRARYLQPGMARDKIEAILGPGSESTGPKGMSELGYALVEESDGWDARYLVIGFRNGKHNSVEKHPSRKRYDRGQWALIDSPSSATGYVCSSKSSNSMWWN